MSKEPASRDNMARLKVYGGLIRLDALNPAGFTAEQLAHHAQANLETARDYLKPEKGYAEQVPNAKAPAEARPGRPSKLYRLRLDSRSKLMQLLTNLRRDLDAAAEVPAPSAEQLFEPIDLLETTVDQLEHSTDLPDTWSERLAEARQEARIAAADLRALNHKKAPETQAFANRLMAIQGRLDAVERTNLPVAQAKLYATLSTPPLGQGHSIAKTALSIAEASASATGQGEGIVAQNSGQASAAMRQSGDAPASEAGAGEVGAESKLAKAAESTTADVRVRDKELLGSSAKVLEVYRQASEKAAGDVQALVSCYLSFGRSMQEAQQKYLDLLGRNLERTAKRRQDLLNCKSPEEFAQVQRDIYTETVDQTIEAASTLLEVGSRAAQEALSPLKKSDAPGGAAPHAMPIGAVRRGSA